MTMRDYKTISVCILAVILVLAVWGFFSDGGIKTDYPTIKNFVQDINERDSNAFNLPCDRFNDCGTKG